MNKKKIKIQFKIKIMKIKILTILKKISDQLCIKATLNHNNKIKPMKNGNELIASLF
jgi:hypothetical protein